MQVTENDSYLGDTLDTRPGDYYVTVTDAGRYLFLAGPYGQHQDALDDVDEVRRIACDRDPKAHWYAFGTARREHDERQITPAGLFNRDLGFPENKC